MELVLERRGDTEVAAAAAQRPEEIRMFLGTCGQHLAGRCYQLDGEQIVNH